MKKNRSDFYHEDRFDRDQDLEEIEEDASNIAAELEVEKESI